MTDEQINKMSDDDVLVALGIYDHLTDDELLSRLFSESE